MQTLVVSREQRRQVMQWLDGTVPDRSALHATGANILSGRDRGWAASNIAGAVNNLQNRRFTRHILGVDHTSSEHSLENLAVKWRLKGITAMPSLKLADAIVLFQPYNARTRSSLRPGAVLVAHRDDRKLINRFEWSVSIAGYVCRSNDPTVQLMALMSVFRLLIVEFGADAKEVDAEFMEIKEYAAALRGDF